MCDHKRLPVLSQILSDRNLSCAAAYILVEYAGGMLQNKRMLEEHKELVDTRGGAVHAGTSYEMQPHEFLS